MAVAPLIPLIAAGLSVAGGVASSVISANAQKKAAKQQAIPAAEVPTETPPEPTPVEPSIAAADTEMRRKQGIRSGLESSILTSPLGLNDEEDQTAAPTLLGF